MPLLSAPNVAAKRVARNVVETPTQVPMHTPTVMRAMTKVPAVC